MKSRVLIIGGYGNFGKLITRMLVREKNIQVIIAGRDENKAKDFVNHLDGLHHIEIAKLDIHSGFEQALKQTKPNIVVHTSGPFQGQSYHVAQACIAQGCHYIDLADGRQFVKGITKLDQKAKDKKVLICSGASSVPCLTGAIIDHYKPKFEKLTKVEYAIATAQLTNRGLATINAVLSYAGKPIKTLKDGGIQDVYGWLGISRRKFWGLNTRLLSYCDIPDLELFPKRYPELETIQFKAGLELKIAHLGLAMLAWFVRIGLVPTIQPLSKILLKMSYLLDPFGKDDSGFYMNLIGVDKNGSPKAINFDLVAWNGDGLCIPCVPSIILAKKLAKGEIRKVGAMPCLDLITMAEYLDVLSEFDVEWKES